ncbi:transporter substrate-binding domain-containing protein [Dethiosulfatarculus sandiegensis]|uniref:transporter substrate-binding domain-containing protein n=1 Tax=Dethiosulfatarculus sandiegensis TaxID=1429043 RepID=UPI00069898E2|nr:transporter substrate-binding domain-containing protein [Dethiosulfatarculus sandiegensis]
MAKIKRLSFGVILSVLFLFSCPAFAEIKTSHIRTITVGGDFYYPPYEFLDDDGRPTGYAVELTKAIAEVMGIKVKIRLGPWGKMRKELEEGKVDALQGMVYTDERQKNYDFTPPHAIIHQSIFHRKGDAPAPDMQSLSGKEVIIQNKGSIHDTFLNSGMNVTLIPTDTHASALRLLASGKHDYAVVANLPGQYLGKKLQLSNLVMSGTPIKSFRYCYAVKKGNVELLALLNEGLSILKNTGRHQKIYEKWFGVYEPKTIAWTLIIKTSLVVIIPLVLILAGVMYWNRTLKREVAIRTNEIYQQQQQLIQADKMSTLGIMASGVAHEINNPNSLVLLNTPIIKDAFEDMLPVMDEYYRYHPEFTLAGLDYDRLRDELPEIISEMLAGAKRIKGIVEDLKDYSRIEDTKDMAPIDINNIIDTSIRLVESHLKKATDNFKFIRGKELKPVMCNIQRIEQVIVNLLMNACQALTSRQQSVIISSYNSRDGASVIVQIQDQGAGIAPEHIGHLTDPFFTTKRNSGGTGLGLSVSANIVKEHSGTLTFESNAGRGSNVRLSIPVKEYPVSEKKVISCI